jgi:hypothetical protein
MIKMIVIDLDETLLRTDKSISAYTIDILKKIRNKGIKVVFATARGNSTKPLIPYELFDGCVLLNGAKAYADNKLVYDRMIFADTFIPFLRKLSNNDLKVAAEIEGVHYANFNVKEVWSYIDKFVVTNYSNVSGNADKLYALVENPSQIDLINSILPKDLYLNLSRDNLAMIMHKEATKSNGVLHIASEFNIQKNEIVAFGDDINDKELLLSVGLSVAMDNSIDEIKMIADYICDSNNDDGVAKWLEKNFIDKQLNLY